MLEIQVVGTGCPNCQKLEALCNDVISDEQLEAQIEKVTDIDQFPELGVFLTPGLIINGEVVSTGKIPTKSTLTHWLTSAVSNTNS